MLDGSRLLRMSLLAALERGERKEKTIRDVLEVITGRGKRRLIEAAMEVARE